MNKKNTVSFSSELNDLKRHTTLQSKKYGVQIIEMFESVKCINEHYSYRASTCGNSTACLARPIAPPPPPFSKPVAPPPSSNAPVEEASSACLKHLD